MTNSSATTIGQVNVEDQIIEQVVSDPLANIWLGFLVACLGGTLLYIAVMNGSHQRPNSAEFADKEYSVILRVPG